VKHLVNIEHLLGVEADFPLDDPVKVHQSGKVVTRFNADIVAIPGDVVELVHIHRVSLVRHHLIQELLLLEEAVAKIGGRGGQ